MFLVTATACGEFTLEYPVIWVDEFTVGYLGVVEGHSVGRIPVNIARTHDQVPLIATDKLTVVALPCQPS